MKTCARWRGADLFNRMWRNNSKFVALINDRNGMFNSLLIGRHSFHERTGWNYFVSGISWFVNQISGQLTTGSCGRRPPSRLMANRVVDSRVEFRDGRRWHTGVDVSDARPVPRTGNRTPVNPFAPIAKCGSSPPLQQQRNYGFSQFLLACVGFHCVLFHF